jgi:DNA-binding SARP family transcriptional activator
LLAYLLFEQRATRREVAARLIPEANDPLAALRWLLHQVRRAIEPEGTIEELAGGFVLLLSDTVTVDLLDLLAVPDDVGIIERLVRGELLEGMDFDDAPAFEMWLSLQRTRLHDVIAEALWWIGSRLGTTDPGRALRITERALLFDPFCETTNELLLDLLVQSGNAPVARQRFRVIERRFREELGVPPADTVRRPLERPRVTSSVHPNASARALLELAAARLSLSDRCDYQRAVEILTPPVQRPAQPDWPRRCPAGCCGRMPGWWSCRPGCRAQPAGVSRRRLGTALTAGRGSPLRARS